MKKIYLILGAVILIMSSYFLDWLFRNYQNLYNLMEPVIPYGVEVAAYVLLTLLSMFLAWVVLYRHSQSSLIAWVFIVLGLVTLFLMTFPGFRFLNSALPLLVDKVYKIRPVLDFLTDIFVSQYSFTRITAAMVLAIGLLRLLPAKKLWPEKP